MLGAMQAGVASNTRARVSIVMYANYALSMLRQCGESADEIRAALDGAGRKDKR
jgi:hypothetical protein